MPPPSHPTHYLLAATFCWGRIRVGELKNVAMRFSAFVVYARLVGAIVVGFGAGVSAGEAPSLWPPPVGVAPERVEARFDSDRPWPSLVATPLGTVVNAPGAAVGFTLFTPSANASGTHLIDNAGRVVYHWEHTLANARMLPNGNLIGKQDNFLFEMDPQGKPAWEYEAPLPMHHDYAKLPNGNVLLLATRERSVEEAIAAGANPAFVDSNGIVSDVILEIRPIYPIGGEVVWQWDVWDHLIQDFDSTKDNYGDVAAHPGRVDLNYALPELSRTDKQPDRRDWLHGNALDYHPELKQVLFSARNFSEVWVVAHGITQEEAAGRAGDLLWRWGNPRTYRAGTGDDQQLFWPHSAHWIPPGLPGAGNVLLFNNGDEFEGTDGRGYSEVVEIEYPLGSETAMPERGEPFGPEGPAWRYRGNPPKSFFSQRTSSAQRLANGNTLILAGLQGTMFEVTPAGETVWQYVNPLNGAMALAQGDPMPVRMHHDRGRIIWGNMLFRVRKYAPDYPGLQALDLTPKGVLERPPEQGAARFSRAVLLGE